MTSSVIENSVMHTYTLLGLAYEWTVSFKNSNALNSVVQKQTTFLSSLCFSIVA